MINKPPHFPLCLCIAALATPLSAPPLNAGEFIRQKQLDTGLTWDFHVPSEKGSRWSPIPVASSGSKLMLFARGTGSDTTLYKLDQTALGDSFPSATITIQSEDPHYPPRTRADKPFRISLNVGKLAKTDTTVNLSHHGLNYETSTHAPQEKAASYAFSEWTISKDGQQHAVLYPSLKAMDPTQAEGKETFTVHMPATGHLTKKSIHIPLGSASIEVWPVAAATITGIKSGETLSAASIRTPVQVHCKDLYPDSVTYVQLYHGEAKLGKKGTVLPQSVIRFDTSVPQDQLIPLGEWRDTLADGKYTIEVLTITPFNNGKPERLTHSTFVIDRGIHTPGVVKN